MDDRQHGWGPPPSNPSNGLFGPPSSAFPPGSLGSAWEGSSRVSPWSISPIGTPINRTTPSMPRPVAEDDDDLLKEVFSSVSSPHDEPMLTYNPFSPSSPFSSSPLPSPVPFFHSRSAPVLPTPPLTNLPKPEDPPQQVFSFDEETPTAPKPPDESREGQPSRTLFVRNISTLSDKDLRTIFSEFGALQHIYTASKNRGFVMVSFFDLRDADKAKQSLNGRPIGEKVIDIHYSFPKESTPKDHLAGFVMLPTNSGDEELLQALSTFGDVKEIRSKGKGGRIVEFFDLRHADAVLNQRLYCGGQAIIPKPVTIQQLRPTPQPNQQRSPKPVPTRPRSQSVDHSNRDRNQRSHAPQPTSDQFVFDPERVLNGVDRRTTLMIKNIPNKYNQKMLLNAFEEQHKGSFDFIYLPIDFKNWCNVGYAFINFVRPEDCLRFYEAFHGQRWKHFNSEKICQISYARIQGKESLIDHFRTSNLMGEDKRCRPMVFDDGHPVKFPAK